MPRIARHRAQRRDIAASPGITERSACGTVTGLTTASYLIKQKDGRRNRHPIQAHPRPREPASQEPATGEPDQPGATAAEADIFMADTRGHHRG